jgi:hypothetical protein
LVIQPFEQCSPADNNTQIMLKSKKYSFMLYRSS